MKLATVPTQAEELTAERDRLALALAECAPDDLDHLEEQLAEVEERLTLARGRDVIERERDEAVERARERRTVDEAEERERHTVALAQLADLADRRLKLAGEIDASTTKLVGLIEETTALGAETSDVYEAARFGSRRNLSNARSVARSIGYRLLPSFRAGGQEIERPVPAFRKSVTELERSALAEFLDGQEGGEV